MRGRGTEYERAKRAILSYLEGGDWHASRELHERLGSEVPKDWLRAVNKELGIEHCQMHGRSMGGFDVQVAELV